MKLTVDQELELYTAVDIPLWLKEHPEYLVDPGIFLNQYRGKWRFTAQQLHNYLAERAHLANEYIQHCRNLVGIHEKVIFVRAGEYYIAFDQDHGSKIELQRSKDWVVTALAWLEYRYMN